MNYVSKIIIIIIIIKIKRIKKKKKIAKGKGEARVESKILIFFLLSLLSKIYGNQIVGFRRSKRQSSYTH